MADFIERLGTTEAEMRWVLRDLHIRVFDLRLDRYVSDNFSQAIAQQLPVTRERRRQQAATREARQQCAITANEAADELRLSPDRIRQWASRGHLSSVGQQGRSQLYKLADVENLKWDLQRRSNSNRQSRYVPREDLDALVTTNMAASIAAVAPSTLRSWVGRGHLQPAADERFRRQGVFRVRDVLAAAEDRRW